MYRQALMELKKPDANLQTSDVVASPLPSEGHQAWEAILAYARGNPSSLRLTREGATRPRLGFIYDPRDAMLRQALGRDALPSAPSDGPLLNLLLPHILELGNLRLLLWADASRALAEGDRPSLLADVRALLGLANQLHEPRTIWGDYFSLLNLSLAAEIVGQVLDQRPELFTDSDLRDLAHDFAGFAGGDPIRTSTDGQRIVFHDLVQRMYTDDGSGDGYLTARGLRLIQDLGGVTNYTEPRSDGALVSLIGPGLTVAIAGRREMIAQADRLFDQLERERRRPLWTGGESQYEKEFRSMHDSKATAIRYLPVLLILPDIQGVAAEREYAACSTQRRDALLGALALTLFRRHQDAWPATLDELTPSLLPAVPIDHFTGKPLRYRLIEGRPVLYSAGRNRVDDAGTTTRDDEQPRTGQPPRADPSYPDDADDWILWRAS
jgi:hypothetical protein